MALYEDLLAPGERVRLPAGSRVLYVASGDACGLAPNEARLSTDHVEGAAGPEGATVLRWELTEWEPEGAKLAAHLELDPWGDYVARCDRVDFPPGAVAYRHTHPGPGIRCLLHGSLRIEAPGVDHVYRPFDAWFEDAGQPVVATASESADTAFVRVLVLPGEWAGKRTIRYLDPADEDKPRLQRPTVLLEEPIEL
jgi:hypothetical protein